MKIHKIEICFPFEIEVSACVFSLISEIIYKNVCQPYEKDHPGRVMWVSSHGSKPSFSRVDAALLGKKEYDENIPDGAEPTFDDSIYEMGIAEREK